MKRQKMNLMEWHQRYRTEEACAQGLAQQALSGRFLLPMLRT